MKEITNHSFNFRQTLFSVSEEAVRELKKLTMESLGEHEYELCYQKRDT